MRKLRKLQCRGCGYQFYVPLPAKEGIYRKILGKLTIGTYGKCDSCGHLGFFANKCTVIKPDRKKYGQ
jgi:hypothetical protein